MELLYGCHIAKESYNYSKADTSTLLDDGDASFNFISRISYFLDMIGSTSARWQIVEEQTKELHK